MRSRTASTAALVALTIAVSARDAVSANWRTRRNPSKGDESSDHKQSKVARTTPQAGDLGDLRRDADGAASDEAKVTEYLVAECRDIGNRLTSYLMVGERMLGTSLAILTLAAGLAVNYKTPYLLMGLPLAFSIVMIYVIYLNTEAASLGGYKAVLEEEITRRLGTPVIFWESRVMPMRHHSLAEYCMHILACLFFAGSIIVALAQAFATESPSHWGHQYASWYVAGTIASIIVSVTVLAISFIFERKSHNHVASVTRTILIAHTRDKD
jgi:hypothetical protein